MEFMLVLCEDVTELAGIFGQKANQFSFGNIAFSDGGIPARFRLHELMDCH